MKIWKCQRCGNRLDGEITGQKYFCPQCRATFSIEFLRDKEEIIRKPTIAELDDLIDQSINKGIYNDLCELEREVSRFEELFDNEQEIEK